MLSHNNSHTHTHARTNNALQQELVTKKIFYKSFIIFTLQQPAACQHFSNVVRDLVLTGIDWKREILGKTRAISLAKAKENSGDTVFLHTRAPSVAVLTPGL